MLVITRIDRSMFAYTSQVRHAASTSLVEVAQLITLDDIGQFVLTIILVCYSTYRPIDINSRLSLFFLLLLLLLAFSATGP